MESIFSLVFLPFLAIIGLIGICRSSSVLFGLFRSFLALFEPFRSILVFFGPSRPFSALFDLYYMWTYFSIDFGMGETVETAIILKIENLVMKSVSIPQDGTLVCYLRYLDLARGTTQDGGTIPKANPVPNSFMAGVWVIIIAMKPKKNVRLFALKKPNWSSLPLTFFVQKLTARWPMYLCVYIGVFIFGFFYEFSVDFGHFFSIIPISSQFCPNYPIFVSKINLVSKSTINTKFILIF